MGKLLLDVSGHLLYLDGRRRPFDHPDFEGVTVRAAVGYAKQPMPIPATWQISRSGWHHVLGFNFLDVTVDELGAVTGSLELLGPGGARHIANIARYHGVGVALPVAPQRWQREYIAFARAAADHYVLEVTGIAFSAPAG